MLNLLKKLIKELVDIIQQDWFIDILYNSYEYSVHLDYPDIKDLFKCGKIKEEDHPCFYHLTKHVSIHDKNFLRPNLGTVNKTLSSHGLGLYYWDYSNTYVICPKKSFFDILFSGYSDY